MIVRKEKHPYRNSEYTIDDIFTMPHIINANVAFPIIKYGYEHFDLFNFQRDQNNIGIYSYIYRYIANKINDIFVLGDFAIHLNA